MQLERRSAGVRSKDVSVSLPRGMGPGQPGLGARHVGFHQQPYRLQRTALPPQRPSSTRPPSSAGYSKSSKVPGDSGWDIFRLRKNDVKTFNRFREVEVIHARWAMLGVASLLVADLSGSPLPWEVARWTPQLLLPYGTLLLLGLGLIDSYRFPFLWQQPWQQQQQQSSDDEVDERVYPGRRFDFLGLMRPPPADEKPPGLGIYSSWVGGFAGWLLGGWWWQRQGLTDKELLDLKSSELRNGRLAMVSFLGVCLASLATGKGPITLLLEHLADPAHHTIVQTLQL